MALCVAAAARAAEKPVTLKFASVAPERTAWAKAVERAGRELQEATSGSLRLKAYFGGVLGDERDVIRKMELGQIHATGAAGAGLSALVPEVHIFNLPFFISTPAEADYMMEQLFPEMQQKFQARGFRLLSFTEGGFCYLFSREPVATVEDFRSEAVKAWLWKDDVANEAIYAAYRVPAVALTVSDVLTGLETGRINTVYGPAAVVVGMRWHSKIRYMTASPFGWSVSGMLLTEDAWRSLTPAQQKTLSEIVGRLARELVVSMREENQRAYETMMRLGIRVTQTLSPEERAEYQRIADEIRRDLVGTLWTQEFLDRAEALLAEYRSRQPGGGS
jgi:TRAP-type transport system periplasmic protein